MLVRPDTGRDQAKRTADAENRHCPLFVWRTNTVPSVLDMELQPGTHGHPSCYHREVRRARRIRTFHLAMVWWTRAPTAIAISTTVFVATATPVATSPQWWNLPTLFQNAAHMVDSNQHDLLVFAENAPEAKTRFIPCLAGFRPWKPVGWSVPDFCTNLGIKRPCWSLASARGTASRNLRPRSRPRIRSRVCD